MGDIYSASIKNTQWIDLSEEHRRIREELESNILQSCLNNQEINPVKIDGAFRIGKTQLLYYLFHYAWSNDVPVFYMNLADIIEILNKEKEKSGNNLLLKAQVTKILNDYFNNTIEALKDPNNPDNVVNCYFPDYGDNKDIIDYIDKLGTANCCSIDGKQSNLKLLNYQVITEVLNKDKRYVLLVDEFEESYHKLNSIVESQGGGPLRNFFDDISKCIADFYLIIGCGPASGYEIQENELESRSAEAGRIKDLHIPFPDVELLQKTFLKDSRRGYINFIWWVSRGRPGLIKKVSDELKYEDVYNCNYHSFIEKHRHTLDLCIEDMGDKKIHLIETEKIQDKSDKTNDLNIFKNMLILLEPISIKELSVNGSSIEDNKEFIEKYQEFIYISEKLIKIEDIIDAFFRSLKTLFESYYESKEFDSKNLVRIYLQKVFSAIANQEGKICIGNIIGDTDRVKLFTAFILSTLNILFEFISEFEKEDKDKIKDLTTFIYRIIYEIDQKKIKPQDEFKEVYKQFRTFDVSETNDVFIQLNLDFLRDIIEQPIGSPVLTYKLKVIEDLIPENLGIDYVFFYEEKLSNITIRFLLFPSLKESNHYQKNLQKYILENWEDYNYSGSIITSILFLSEEKTLKESENAIYAKLSKLTFNNINDIPGRSHHVSRFVDSICKIGIIGLTNNDINLEYPQGLIDISKIIEIIEKPDWSLRKEDRKAIGYYNKLMKSSFTEFAKTLKADYIKHIEEDTDINIQELAEILRKEVKLRNINDGFLDNEKLFTYMLCDNADIYNEELQEIIKAIKQLNITADYEINFNKISSFLLDNDNFIEHNKKVFQNNIASDLKYISDKIINEDDKISYETSTLEKILEPFIRDSLDLHKLFLRALFKLKVIDKNYNKSFEQLKEDCSKNIKRILQDIEEMNSKLEKINEQLENLLVYNSSASIDISYIDSIRGLLLKVKKVLESESNINLQKFIYIEVTDYINKAIDEFINSYSKTIEHLLKVTSNLASYRDEIKKLQKEFDEIYKKPMNKVIFDEKYKKPEKDFYKKKVLNPLKNKLPSTIKVPYTCVSHDELMVFFTND